MLNAVPKQFSLNESGYITYQAVLNDPRPGVIVAGLKKGAHALEPEIELVDTAVLEGQDKDAVRQHLSYWLRSHIETVLQPLVALKDILEEMAEPVKRICASVYEAIGTMPRAELEEFTAALDVDMRRDIRTKGITLGPLLVFMRELNKPAAVKLRGVLWSVYNDKPLPFDMPKDGAVSFRINHETIDRDLYRTIGYPVYGSRAVRIDMLDRVVTAVYDSAKNGKFQAQHQMAEWLGCPIEELYAILEDMGHKKIADPSLEEKEEKEQEETQKVTQENQDSELKKEPDQKPALATFQLKRGKAHIKQQKREFAKKPHKKKAQSRAKSKPKPKDKSKPKDMGPKIISSGPEKNLEDSPFAILGQLKNKN